MAIRPVDMQLNVVKDDNAKVAQKDKMHQEGQARFDPLIQKEQDLKKEQVTEMEKNTFTEVNDRDQGTRKNPEQGGEQKKKRQQKTERIEVKDPDLGNKIDIKS